MQAAETYDDPEILIRCSDLVELRECIKQMRDLIAQQRNHLNDLVTNGFDVVTRLERLEASMERVL